MERRWGRVVPQSSRVCQRQVGRVVARCPGPCNPSTKVSTWSRRQGTPGICSTESSSEGASVPRASRTDRGSVGTEKQRHVGRVASAKTRTAKCNSTRGDGLLFSLGNPSQFNRKIFVDCLRSALSGSAPGPGGCTHELQRVCLDDHETRSNMMTAFQKKDGGVRGIATGTSFTRLVAKTLARTIHVRSGGDVFSVPSSLCPHGLAQIVSVMPSMWPLKRIMRQPCCPSTEWGRTTTSIGARCCQNFWKFRVSNPCCHSCAQRAVSPHGTSGDTMRGTAMTSNSMKAEGDLLMPLLFSLAIHNALAAVKEELKAGEMLFAFLDCQVRPHTIYNLLAEKLQFRLL